MNDLRADDHVEANHSIKGDPQGSFGSTIVSDFMETKLEYDKVDQFLR